MKLRTLIKTSRTAGGVSLLDLANALECSVEELEAFESGSSSLAANLLFGVINILNIAPEDVMPLLDEGALSVAAAGQLNGGLNDAAILPLLRKN